MSLMDPIEDGVSESVEPGEKPRKERRKLGKRRGVPRGGKAGLAGEDATWSRDKLSRHHIISAHHFAKSAEVIEAHGFADRSRSGDDAHVE